MEILKQNWQLILSAIVSLVSIITMLVKKPVSSDLWDKSIAQVIELIPTFINKVETDGNGKAKKAIVLEASITTLEKILHRNLTADELSTADLKFSDSIEAILSTPQKKTIDEKEV